MNDQPYRSAPVVTNVTKNYDFSSLGRWLFRTVLIVLVGTALAGLLFWAREYQRTCTDSEHPIYSGESYSKRCDAHAVGSIEVIPADKDHAPTTAFICRCEAK